MLRPPIISFERAFTSFVLQFFLGWATVLFIFISPVENCTFRLVNYDNRAMLTACVATIGRRMVDRNCRGRAAEAASTAIVCDCTMREDADNSIKKSISRRKNHASARNIDVEDSEFYEEVASSSSDDETFPNAWLTEEGEMVEIAALVPFYLRSELRNMYGVASSFPHLILLENGPKAVAVEEETWWTAYWTIEEVQKAKTHQDGSNRVVDLYDCCTRAIYELCAKMNRK